MRTPMSEVEENYQEDICDFWDSLGIYMDPIPLPETTKEPTTVSGISDPPNIVDTTSAATSYMLTNHRFLFIVLPAVIFSLTL